MEDERERSITWFAEPKTLTLKDPLQLVLVWKKKKENDDVENDDNRPTRQHMVCEKDSPKITPSAEPITLY
jgi:hypothetical protein